MFVMLFLQVFGSLLSTKADKKEDEPDGAEKEEKDQQVLVKKFSLSKETFLIFYLLIYAHTFLIVSVIRDRSSRAVG